MDPVKADRFALGLRLTKFDEASRTVEGLATSEDFDQAGELVDYDSAKKAIVGSWPGNLREMHQLQAVGTGVVVDCDDVAKTIRIRGTISKGAPLTFEKVKDGTLKGFSIGGPTPVRVLEKTAEGREFKRVHPTRITEISLVDNPCNPACGFTMLKAAGADETATLEGAADDTPLAEVAPAAPAVEKPAEVEAETKKVLVFTTRAALMKAVAAKADSRILAVAGPTVVSALEQAALQKRYLPEPYDVARAATVIAALNEMVASEMYDIGGREMNGDDVSADLEQLALLRTACEAVIDFLLSEFAAQFGAMAGGGPDLMLATDGSAIRQALIGVMAKVSAQPTTSEAALMQAVHDAARGRGSVCAETLAKVDTGTTAIEAQLQKVTADLETTTTRLAEITKVAEQDKTTMTAQAATIADLATRMQRLEDSPVPGGPVTRSAGAQLVDKTVGGVPANGGPASDPAVQTVIAALENLVKTAPNESERERAMTELHKVTVQLGIGVSVVRTT